MSIEFDFSEMHQFSAEIALDAPDLVANVRKAVTTTAFRGRKEWQASARGNAGVHLPSYPSSIDYDPIKWAGGNVETKLGPNLDRPQGALGIVEDAPGGVRAAPQRNYEKAEKLIEEDLVKGVLAAVEDSFGGA